MHPIQRVPRWVLPAAAVVAVFCIVFPLPMDAGTPTTASVTLSNAAGPPNRTVNATVRLAPKGAATHADWLTITAWQGGGLVVDRLKRVGDGVYATTQPIPVYGKWKSMLRMENGRGLVAAPVFLPADPAIPAKGVPAKTTFTRPFVRDKDVLQREAVGGSGGLALVAYAVLAAIAAAWLAVLGWGLRRLEKTAGEPYPGDDDPSIRFARERDEADVPRPALGVQA